MFCSSCGTVVTGEAAFCPACGTRMRSGPAMAATGPAIPQPAPAYPGYLAVPAMDYATWGTRALGFIIDGLLVGVGMVVLYVVLGGMLATIGGLAGHGMATGMCCFLIILFPLATLLVGLFNGVYLVSQRGASIGQGLVKVKVVDANGRLLSQGTAFLRLVVRVALGVIAVLTILDLLWPLWDERRQTLHDKAVNCYVINNPQGF